MQNVDNMQTEQAGETDVAEYVAPSIVDIDTANDREFAVMPAATGSQPVFD